MTLREEMRDGRPSPWEPTLGLRLLTFPNGQKVIQQAWKHIGRGTIEWRDVPEVPVDADA